MCRACEIDGRQGEVKNCGSTQSALPTWFPAHKWFNIAAMRGDREAARLRREIAEEMSEADIAAAQRAARDWITRH